MNPTRHVAWLMVWCGIALAQDPPKPPDARDPAKSAGESQSFTLGNANEPLRISAQYANSERDGTVDLFTARGAVEAWQGDRRAPSFLLTCEALVVWRTDTDRLDPATGKPIQRTEFYAENNVRFSRLREVLFGQRMYFDLDANFALISHARYQTTIQRASEGGESTTIRTIPLIIAARQFRVLSASRSIAQDASFTTSSFGDPSYRFQASNILLDSAVDEKTGERTLRTLHSRSVPRVIEPHGRNDIPLMFFPYLSLNREDDFILKRLDAGSDSDFGTFLFTRWGQRIGDWGSWFLDIDVSSDRGVAFGPGAKYNTFDPFGNKYKGNAHFYGLQDQKVRDERTTDSDDPSVEDEGGTPENRYRIRTQHRHQFPDKLRLDLEISKQSDSAFLEEFFERELREDKEQETLIHAIKQFDNHQASLLAKYELNDFVTTTEYLPQLRGDTLSEPVYDNNSILRNLYWTQASQLAYLRRQIAGNISRQVVNEETGEATIEDLGKDPDDGRDQVRGDSAQELAYPFSIGPARLYPFLGARPGYFSDPLSGGGGRIIGSGGLRLSTQFHRTYHVRVPALDISNLQHVITPEIRYLNQVSTKDSEDLFFYDEVDTADDLHVITLKLLNRLKTRRFSTPLHDAIRFPGRKRPTEDPIGFGRSRQGSIVELMSLDVELPLYPDGDRDNGGRSIGDLDVEYEWQILRWLSMAMDGEVRFQDGDARPVDEELDSADRRRSRVGEDFIEREDAADEVQKPIGSGLKTFNISFTIQSPNNDYPRWTLRPGYRYAKEVTNAPFIDATFAVNPKWELGLGFDYETFQEAHIDNVRLRVRRYFDRVVVEFEVEHDQGANGESDETKFKVRIRLREQLKDDNNGEQNDDDPPTPEEAKQGSILESVAGAPPAGKAAAGDTAPKKK